MTRLSPVDFPAQSELVVLSTVVRCRLAALQHYSEVSSWQNEVKPHFPEFSERWNSIGVRRLYTHYCIRI